MENTRNEHDRLTLRSILLSQFKTLRTILLMVYVPTFLSLCIIVILRLLINIPIRVITRDLAQIVKAPFYYGMLSNIGILFWCSTSAICLFSFLILGRDVKIIRERRLFLLVSGLITAILLLDDFFLVHDIIFPINLGIDEKIVFFVYGLMILLYILRFWRTIFETEFLILGFAFIFFALSLLWDRFDHERYGHYLIEDGFKFFGIVSWFTYFLRLCIKEVVIPNVSGPKSG